MSTHSNAVPNTPLEAQAASPVMAPAQPFYWSVLRELWENRSIYLAPPVVALVFLFGFMISLISFPHKMRMLSAVNPAQQQQTIIAPVDYAAGLLMVTSMIVALFYCLDALYGERRDRSILFWKSLPVSDATIVLSKAAIPYLVLPLITFALTAVVQLVILLLGSMTLLGSGASVAMLWKHVPLLWMWVLLFYHLFAVHVLMHAPFYAWLLLVSAWAKRAPFLWAILPPLAIGIFEKIAFNSSHFAHMLLWQLAGGSEVMTVSDRWPMDPGTHMMVLRLLSTPGLWIGLLITAGCLAGAIRLRRYRDPI